MCTTKTGKGLVLAHLNICGIRNKIHDIFNLVNKYSINILAVSETHLDSSIQISELTVKGFNVFRKDRNRFGGGVAIFVQSNIPCRLKQNLLCHDIEAIWVEVHVPYMKPVLVGCCYRPPDAHVDYLTCLGEMLDKVSDVNCELYLLGDMNIDWNDDRCSKKKKLLSYICVCNLHQIVNVPTRIFSNRVGITTATCIDHIYTNVPEMCSDVVSTPVGFSDHNLIAVTRKAKVPKVKAICGTYKRFYKVLAIEKIVGKVKNVDWKDVYSGHNPEDSLDAFMSMLLSIVDQRMKLKKWL